MAIAVKVFGQGMLKIATGSIDLDTDTFKFMQTTSTYVPNLDTHDFRDDVTNEITGSGYAQQTLSGVTVTYDSASDQVRFDCNDITQSFSGSITWRNGVVYKSRGGAASADELLGYLDWVTDQTVSTTYTLTIDPTGLFFWDVT